MQKCKQTQRNHNQNRKRNIRIEHNYVDYVIFEVKNDLIIMHRIF